MLLEEGAIVAAGVLALAAFTFPPLPMFPPQGLPQPQAIGGGTLPTVALTVSNTKVVPFHLYYNEIG